MDAVSPNFPPEFDPTIYRKRYTDLSHLSDDDLATHFVEHGMNEGRCASAIEGRTDFFSLISASLNALEIGPFNNPSVTGPRVKYFDTLSTVDLKKRAKEIGIDQSNIPEIHWISPDGDLSVVQELFDCCVSSHAIEHQPDLVRHLINVAGLLSPGGRYFLAVPDRRFTFDHFLKDSNIAEVIEAHHEGRQRHTLQSVIEHRALTTHNDPVAHWNGTHGDDEIDASKIQSAIREFEETDGYLDVHAWIFTPSSFRIIMMALFQLGLTQLSVERVYPTLRGSNEFYVILRKQRFN
jgi:SAM-dependent methyltransferase